MTVHVVVEVIWKKTLVMNGTRRSLIIFQINLIVTVTKGISYMLLVREDREP